MVLVSLNLVMKSHLFDLYMSFYYRDRLVCILWSVQIFLDDMCYVLNVFAEYCLYGRLSVNLCA